jgi:GTP-binding protein
MASTEPLFSAEEIDAGRRLFAQDCRFIMGAVRIDQLPPPDRVEVAFAGRSNVGKSSLINALTGRKTLARTSNTPGRTREINFFDLGDPPGAQLRLTDLPGYGYARASKSAVKAWNALIHDYLQGRPTLRRACLLIDARHGVKPNDEEIMTVLDRDAVSYQLVLTKCDKLPEAAVQTLIDGLGPLFPKHPACHPLVLPTSTKTGAGLPELRAALASLAVTQ